MKKLLSLILAAVLVTALMPVSVFASGSGAPKDIAIHEVNIEGFIPPVVGSTPEFSYNLYVEEGHGYGLLYSYWYDATEGHDMTVEQVPFVADHMYANGCIIYAEEGYYFADDCVYSFNGDPDLVDPDYPQPFYLGGCVIVQSTSVAPTSATVGELGDVNGDGNVDFSDALLVLRAGMGIISLAPDQEMLADVNHDGSIDLTDALLILRYAMGLIPTL